MKIIIASIFLFLGAVTAITLTSVSVARAETVIALSQDSTQQGLGISATPEH